MYRFFWSTCGLGLLLILTSSLLQRGQFGGTYLTSFGSSITSVKRKRVSQCLHRAWPGITHGGAAPVGSVGLGIVDSCVIITQSRQPQRTHSGPVTGSRSIIGASCVVGRTTSVAGRIVSTHGLLVDAGGLDPQWEPLRYWPRCWRWLSTARRAATGCRG